MEPSLINQGLDLALIGMGTVFAFLTLLVGVTTGMSALVHRYLREASPLPASSVPPRAGDGNDAVDAEVLAAIAAAVHQHRSRE